MLQREQELGQIAAANKINPNLLRNRKKEFVTNASRASDKTCQEKQTRQKEETLKKKQEQMLRTIGQLTLERDFLQDCFRAAGRPIPGLDPDGQ